MDSYHRDERGRATLVLPLVLLLSVSMALVSVVVLKLSMVVLVLAVFALVVLALSFLTADPIDYWLAIFVLALPVNVTKLLFFAPEEVQALMLRYGLKGIENLVPLIYAFDLPFLVLLVLGLVRTGAERRRLSLPKGLFLALAYVLWCVVTLVNAPARVLGTTYILYQLEMLLILVVVLLLVEKRRTMRAVTWALVAGVGLQAAVTMYSYGFQVGENLWGGMFGARYTLAASDSGPVGTGGSTVYEGGALLRGTGTIGAGNEEAKYFVLLLPLVLVFVVTGSSWGRRIALGILLAGMAAVYLTFSRGGMISAAVALVTCFYFLSRRRLLPERSFLRAAVLGATLAALASPFIYGYFTSRPHYLTTRFDHFIGGVRIALEHPLAGVGINNFVVAVSPFDYGGIFRIPVHNHYVRVWSETGFIGLALYLSFFAWIWWRAYRATFLEDRFLAGVAIAVLSGLTGILVYWTDDIFYGVIIRAHTWLLAALVLAVSRIGEGALESSSEVRSRAPGRDSRDEDVPGRLGAPAPLS